MYRKIFYVVAPIIIISLVVFAVYSQSNTKSQATWEYLVIPDPTITWLNNQTRAKQELDKLGEQGWELVGTSGEVVSEGNGTQIRLYFKRPK